MLFVVLASGCKKFVDEENNTSSSGLELVGSYDGGAAYKLKNTDFKILVLEGTFRQMGRQYGQLMDAEITSIYQLISDRLKSQGWSDDSLASYAKYLELTQPQLIKEIVYGISETSSLSKEEQFICSSFLRVFNKPCGSTFTAWGDYTNKKPLNTAQSWEYAIDELSDFKEFLTLVVYKPKGIGNSFAEVNFAGSVYFQSGINNRRLYLNIQSAVLSDDQIKPERVPVEYEAITYLLDYATVDAIEVPLNALNADASVIINAVDVNNAAVFQCPTYNIHRRNPSLNGYLIATNHFVDPPVGWPVLELPPLPYSCWTNERRNNALSFGNIYKGGFNTELMQNLLAIPVKDGGVSFAENIWFETIFQTITVPVDLDMYLRVPGRFEWKLIELQALFDL
jgi:hypothetical protein